MKKFSLFCALAGSLLVGAPAPAATLQVGDPAPAFQPGQWLQGEPVSGFDSNHVYVIVFWATWYAATCEAALVRLDGWAHQYQDRGLIAIGQDVMELDDSAVPAYVKKLGGRVTCRLALDDKRQEKDGAMAVSWLKAAGQTGVPTVFVVDRHGRIAWIGHPLALQPNVIDQLLANQFDLAASARDAARRQQQQEQLEAHQHALSKNLNDALKASDWDAADAALAEIEQSLTEAARPQIRPLRVRILLGRQDYVGAGQLAADLSDLYPTNVYLQNELAWTLATTKGVDQPGWAVARKAAERANQASSGKVPGVLDTLARTQFLTGQSNQAIATEEQALALAPPEVKPVLQKSLSAYLQGSLPDVSP